MLKQGLSKSETGLGTRENLGQRQGCYGADKGLGSRNSLGAEVRSWRRTQGDKNKFE